MLTLADRSRRSIFVAHNSLGGSEAVKWANRVTELRAEIKALEQRLPSGNGVHKLSDEELVAELLEVQGYQVRAADVQRELEQGRQQDDIAFVEYRADQRAVLAAKIAQKG